MKDKPYCTCLRGRRDGFTNIGNQTWVHINCGKVTKMVWLKTMFWSELDSIIKRLMTGQESADGLDKGRAEIACIFLAILEDSDIVKIRNRALLRFKKTQSNREVTT